MSYLSQAESFQGVVDVFLRDPERYAPLLQFIESVMEAESSLTKAEREMIAAHVSKLNGCDFCLGAHKWTLAAMDIEPRVIEAVEAGPEDAEVDERMRPVLRFAGKLTQTPERIGQGDIEALRAAGWSDQAIEDTINVVALFNYVNRLVDAFGIKGSESYFKQIGASLAKQGYGPLIKSALKKAS
ncbi:MAG: peroxidase-related enzyme [Kiloniellales bacterium]|nr:peroxidase-related enzyme [Kiloniellales bacterium]